MGACSVGFDPYHRNQFPPGIPVRVVWFYPPAYSFSLNHALIHLSLGRRHLLGIGRDQEALEALTYLNGVPADDPIVQEALEELAVAIREENEGGKATWIECFSPNAFMYKRTINGMMLQFIQQLNGQNFYVRPLPPSSLTSSVSLGAEECGGF